MFWFLLVFHTGSTFRHQLNIRMLLESNYKSRPTLANSFIILEAMLFLTKPIPLVPKCNAVHNEILSLNIA